MKTKDLIGPALDYAVALCEGYKFGKPHMPNNSAYWRFPVSVPGESYLGCAILEHGCLLGVPSYSTSLQGDDIIDREGISVIRCDDDDYGRDAQGFTTNERIPVWAATTGQHGTTSSTEHQQHNEMFQIDESSVVYGPTRRVAAMRCFVNVRLGIEVEIPEELL